MSNRDPVIQPAYSTTPVNHISEHSNEDATPLGKNQGQPNAVRDACPIYGPHQSRMSNREVHHRHSTSDGSHDTDGSNHGCMPPERRDSQPGAAVPSGSGQDGAIPAVAAVSGKPTESGVKAPEPAVPGRPEEKMKMGSLNNPYEFGKGVLAGSHAPLVSDDNPYVFAKDRENNIYMLHIKNRKGDEKSWTNPWVKVPESALQPSAGSIAPPTTPNSPAAGNQPTTPTIPNSPAAGNQPSTPTIPNPPAAGNQPRTPTIPNPPATGNQPATPTAPGSFATRSQPATPTAPDSPAAVNRQQEQEINKIRQIYDQGGFGLDADKRKQLSTAALIGAWVQYKQEAMASNTLNNVEGKEILQRVQTIEDEHAKAKEEGDDSKIEALDREFLQLIEETAGDLPPRVEQLNEIFLNQILFSFWNQSQSSNASPQQNPES
ncbi:hypothetical protein [Veronia pacifica]|uniref:hypothetical protein n=1 Tax=Veronia pacifica TaxID=1080227 RepID=UPI003643CEC7